MDLDISNNLINENQSNREEVNAFIKELGEMINKIDIDNKNFINELKDEFHISKDNCVELQNKIENYISEFAYRTGWETLYIGYDSNKNKYYQDCYVDKENKRFYLTKKDMENFDVGMFYTVGTDETGFKTYISDADYLKKAIQLSIKEQLKDGKSINEINLFELKDDYKEMSLIAPIYEKCEVKKENRKE